MNDIRTITIDLDDTLWEINPVIRRAEARLYEWMSEHYPRITEMFGPEEFRILRTEVLAEFKDHLHDLTLIRRTVLARLGEAAGYGDSHVDAAFEVFDEARNDVTLFPGVKSALRTLRERFVLVAVTNGNANLEKIGIHDLFDDIVTAAMAGAAKPARPIFDAAVKAGGASAEQTLHVGDHPEIDVVGALEAGLKSVWVNRDEHEWPDHLRPPDGVVRDLGELFALLDSG